MATLAELKADLAAYKKAEQSILLGGQGVEYAGRKLTRATLAEIRAAIQTLETRISLATTPQHGNVVFGARR